MMSAPINSSSNESFEVSNGTLSTNTNTISNFPSYHNIPSHVTTTPPITLPKGYQPSNFDVICGRGRGHYNQPGNIRFRSLINSKLNEYQLLKTKIDKSIFINRILDEVCSLDNNNARFVRQVSCDTWEILSDDQAREKIGHAIREALAPRSKPSSKLQEVISGSASKMTADLVTSTEVSSAGGPSEPDDVVSDTTHLSRRCTDSILDTRKRSIMSTPPKTIRAATLCWQRSPDRNALLPSAISMEGKNIDLKDFHSQSPSEQTVINTNALVNPPNIVKSAADEIIFPSWISTNNNAWSEYQSSKTESKQLDLLLDDFGDYEMHIKVNNYYDPPEAILRGREEKDEEDDNVCKRLSGISITCGLKFHSVNTSLAEDYCKINSCYYPDMISSNDEVDDDDICRRLSGLSVMSLNTLLT